MPMTKITHKILAVFTGAQQELRWATVATIDMDRKLGAVPLLAGNCDPI